MFFQPPTGGKVFFVFLEAKNDKKFKKIYFPFNRSKPVLPIFGKEKFAFIMVMVLCTRIINKVSAIKKIKKISGSVIFFKQQRACMDKFTDILELN